ncbi:methionyl-tRNA formyltransferase [Polluticoccus soli]|uniref:methionyl-tRNA formyltransferase n=1 Tax=Polluticoccus soli TaxID=3034150 RepID=UPI0023E1B872|nr:formyltransferase family protein [Flavipsychrobacter sp. JY13-12]
MKLLILCNDRMALPATNRLLQSGIVAGIGMAERESEVHTIVRMLCANYNVSFRQFSKTTFTDDLKEWVSTAAADAVLVKTFPWKIPANVLNVPKQGFINFHYAPLPAYRGPNPLFWMVKDGAKEAGVSVHRMTAEIDEGPILFRSTIPIHTGVTFGMLCSQLGFNGMELTDKVLQALSAGNIAEQKQDVTGTNWYKRPSPADLQIKWSAMDAYAIHRLVNACNPWNKGAAALLNGWMLGLTYVTPGHLKLENEITPGTILAIDEQNGLRIACAGRTEIRVDVIYTEEGFMPGFALANFGVRPGTSFHLI